MIKTDACLNKRAPRTTPADQEIHASAALDAILFPDRSSRTTLSKTAQCQPNPRARRCACTPDHHRPNEAAPESALARPDQLLNVEPVHDRWAAEGKKADLPALLTWAAGAQTGFPL